MKTRKRGPVKTAAGILAAIVLFCAAAGIFGYARSLSRRSGVYLYTDEERLVSSPDSEALGEVRISTLPVELEYGVRRASYTFGDSVLVGCRDGSDTVICSLKDDGSDLKELFRGRISSSYRLLPFADNARVLLGDYVLECPEGTTFETCPPDSALLVPLLLPETFSSDPSVTDPWTEVIIAPDCEHFAWTIRRSDCGAVNAMGRLVRRADRYEVEDAVYISRMEPFREDPEKPGSFLYTPVIGGEVKQFVHGGRAISLVGADPCGMADSVIQDVATGEVTQLTFAPGYDETTILSPDEELGIVMTTRFSETTDLAALGLLPRPIGQPLHNILGQIYMYGVTGVRAGREGSIGPALIDISQSMTDPDYRGIDLSDPSGEWVYLSPMSWNKDSTRAMWIERQKEGSGFRVQIASIEGKAPGRPAETVETPAAGTYGTSPAQYPDYDIQVEGRVSGSARMVKTGGKRGSASVSVTYDGYSDDGIYFYSGTEESSGSVMSVTDYRSDLTVLDADGRECGSMHAVLRFSPAYSIRTLLEGNTSPHLDREWSSGTAAWQNKEADLTKLVP